MYKQRKTKRFYALVGKNAVGVYDNYNLALVQRTYVISPLIKSFDNLEDAKDYCIDIYDETVSPFTHRAIMPKDLKLDFLNHFKFFKKM